MRLYICLCAARNIALSGGDVEEQEWSRAVAARAPLSTFTGSGAPSSRWALTISLQNRLSYELKLDGVPLLLQTVPKNNPHVHLNSANYTDRAGVKLIHTVCSELA